MPRCFFSRLLSFSSLFRSLALVASIFLCLSCGRAYFPLQLQTVSRSERATQQETTNVQFVALTTISAKEANSDPYKRLIIEAGNFNKPAKIIPVNRALKLRTPQNNDPGPYVIGVGDVIKFTQFFSNENNERNLISRELVVKADGFVYINELGNVKALDLTQSQLEDFIYKRLIEVGEDKNFELNILQFNSKTITVVSDVGPTTSVPYVATPMYLESLLIKLGVKRSPGFDIKVVLLRGNEEYTFSFDRLIEQPSNTYRLFPDDKIFVKPLNYKKESILILGETGQQTMVAIDANKRPTLSDAIFSGNVLNNNTSDFSQIYVLRKKDKNFRAFHLDITDPSRVSLATKFEMRPDDIIFVATQPLSLYSRTLSQILGSTGLTLQARDTIRTEIGN